MLPTRNGSAHIEEQLSALASQVWHRDWDILFVDNGSNDATPEILQRWIPRFEVPARVVNATEEFSLAYARNFGASAATGRSICFIDDDDVIAPNWVAAIGECLELHEFVGSSFEYSFLNSPGAAEPRGTFQVHKLGTVLGVPVISGGGSGCRREVFNAIGGNDRSFNRAGEDIDFSLRVTKLGHIEPHLCQAATYHVRVRSSPADSFRQGYRFAQSAVALYRRHGSWTGSQPMGWVELMRRWAGLVRRLPEVRRHGGRLKWAWQLGTRLGHLVGSLQQRKWYP